MTRSWTWVTVVGLVAVACGGTTAVPVVGDAGQDASVDAASDASGDGGACVPSPVPGSACKVGDVSCDVVNACCAPSYTCSPQSNKWELLAVGCACMGFKCGDKTCTGTQICLEHGTGVDGGADGGGYGIASYECADYPSACARQWTCDCLKKTTIGPTCILPVSGACDASTGHPVLSCMGV